MRLYADSPVRRTRQVLTDVLALGWLALCVAVGVTVHGALGALAAPFRDVAAVGGQIETSMSTAAGAATDVPLVGDRLGAPFEEAAAAGRRLGEAGLDGAAHVGGLAVVVGVLVALLPALLVLVPWLAGRLRFARQAGEARTLAATPAGRDLLAVRALATQPLSRLTADGSDPVGGWRAEDAATVERLAALELDRWGLRL